MIYWLLIFIISIIVLVKSADIFTENAKKLGLALGMPAFIVGVIIVSLGTSIPELISSIFAVLSNTSEFVAGNVIGSNIANIFLVLGVASIISTRFVIKWNLIKIDIPILLGSALLLYLTTLDGTFDFIDGLICLSGYLIYVIHSIQKHKESNNKSTLKFSLKYPIFLILSSIGIYVGADFLIKSVINLSTIFGFSDTSVIALTAVAIGTSLPELLVSAIAAKKGHYEMAIGNVIGSNIFNSFVVMSIPSFLTTLSIPPTITNLGLPFMLAATLFYIISTLDKEVTKYEGYMSILIYILFIWMLF